MTERAPRLVERPAGVHPRYGQGIGEHVLSFSSEQCRTKARRGGARGHDGRFT